MAETCSVPISKPNVLFDIGDTKMISHNFEVRPGEVWVVVAQGLMDGDEIAVEIVTGCGYGDFFECYRSASCGCPVVLDCATHRVVIPFTGRYRLVIQTGNPGDYRVTAYPTADVGYSEGSMACNKCNEQTPAEIIDSISGSPSAVAGLCALLQPCITAAIGPDEPLDPAAIVNAIGNDGAALAGLCTYMQPCITAAIGPGGTMDPAAIVNAIGNDVAALAGMCAYMKPCIDHFIDDKMVTYLEDVVVPGLPGAVALNPAGYELITDTFGVPLAYAFPV